MGSESGLRSQLKGAIFCFDLFKITFMSMSFSVRVKTLKWTSLRNFRYFGNLTHAIRMMKCFNFYLLNFLTNLILINLKTLIYYFKTVI